MNAYRVFIVLVTIARIYAHYVYLALFGDSFSTCLDKFQLTVELIWRIYELYIMYVST